MRAFLLCSMLLLNSIATASDDPDLQWQWRVEPASTRSGDEVELVFTAELPDGFILYASDFKAELGPRPAKVSFESNDAIEITAPLQAIKSQRRTDKTFGTEYSYFAGHAEFRQKARLLKNEGSVKGRIDAQTCQEKNGLCILVRETFAIDLR